ncbi:MAG: 4-hydroxy-tetrahydrodipicolinate reductase [Elusimicrobia bacterium]|nr:4-hydroxy-tetrahydrodipicolinate reductase [Elusimicrobiota bacterium]
MEERRVKIVIGGLYGHMGSRIAALAERENSGVLVVGGLVRELQHYREAETYSVMIDVREAMELARVLIEFTTPEATMSHLRSIRVLKKAAVIGTTGFSEDDIKEIWSLAQDMPVVLDSNFSTGMGVLRQALDQAVKQLGDGFDAGMVEIHRRGKKDAPSGTAKDLAGRLTRALGESPPIVSLRMGGVPGEHAVYLASDHEIIEIVHRVYSRDAFALGALQAARWVSRQPPGLYSFDQVLASAVERSRRESK